MPLLDVIAAPRFGTKPVAWCTNHRPGGPMPTLINVTPEEFEDALVGIARHIPLRVEIGRPIGAKRDQGEELMAIATEDGDVWFYGPDLVGSFVFIGDQWVYHEWRWQVEIQHRVGYAAA